MDVPLEPPGGRLVDRIPAVLEQRSVEVAVQPIVDLQSGGVAGYEALARFPRPGPGPDAWFQAARMAGRSTEMDALVVERVLELQPDLPVNCFLTLNADPDSLGSSEIEAVLGHRRLDGLVIEVTEHVRLAEGSAGEAALDRYRAQGAMIALDDAGAGHSGLQQILRLRPSFLKVDRSLIEGIDRDEAKVAMVEMLGVLANRLDAWVIAEGIERSAEATVLRSLGVPLAQGYAFGRPGPPWPNVSSSVMALVSPASSGAPSVGSLAIDTPTIEIELAGESGVFFSLMQDWDHLVVVDGFRRPIGLLGRTGSRNFAPFIVNVNDSVAEVASRLATRPPERLADPVICRDDRGHYAGTVSAMRILASLGSAA